MPINISETELQILKYLWSQSNPKTFSEIMEYFNSCEKKEWKKQTLNTFLLRLTKKGYLITDKSAGRALYRPSISSERYYQQYANQILDKSFGSSLFSFVSAFTGNRTLSKDEKEELLEYLKGL